MAADARPTMPAAPVDNNPSAGPADRSPCDRPRAQSRVHAEAAAGTTSVPPSVEVQRRGEWISARPSAIYKGGSVFTARGGPIDRVYTALQDKAVGEPVRTTSIRGRAIGERRRKNAPDVFIWVVRIYPIVLFALLFVVALVAWSRP
jgi:hypothetical protein